MTGSNCIIAASRTEEIKSLPIVNLNSSRIELLEYFNNTWQLTEALFACLKDDSVFYKTPDHRLRHPIIFYYAHPAVLYVNKLLVAGVIKEQIDPEMELLFETGVDEMRWDNMHEENQNIWPEIEKVHAYRSKVYDLVKDLILNHESLDNLPITQQHPMWALVMGFEHERIHLETSSVLFREMDVENFARTDNFPSLAAQNITAPNNDMIRIQAGEVQLGKPENHPSYGWDNEYGSEARKYRDFSASKFLISNAEYLEFVKDGGYRNEEFWSKQGWEWRKFNNTKWPRFWVQDGPAGSAKFKLRTLFEEIEMQNSWPAIVNFHEAKAYCEWLNSKDELDVPFRLLTEAEHNAIRSEEEIEANSELAYSSESAVNAYTANSKGFHDVFGSVWQWCEDHFHPLEDSKPHPYYDDFSAPCYDGEHQIILGGSFISTGDEATKYARFHFRSHFYQHAGFRIARYEDGRKKLDAKIISNKDNNKYETDDVLASYLLLGFGKNEDIFEERLFGKFPKPHALDLTEECVNLAKKHTSNFGKALDLGSAIGATAFQLTKHYDQVLGIEYAKKFVATAKKLQEKRGMEFFRKDSGNNGHKMSVSLDADVDTNKASFEQGDASNLRDNLGSFDSVILSNVICRLPNIKACLSRMGGENALVEKGGVLVITSPYSWFEEYSEEDNWITENPIEKLGAMLPEFELVEEKEIPFMIREHSRKFEYIVTHATVWKRK